MDWFRATLGYRFDKTGFWVKAYDVPVLRQTRGFAQFMGGKVGHFLYCDEVELLKTWKTLCFRAEVDVLKVLRRGVMVKIDGKTLWMKFRYLKLLDFCYGCGILGYTLKAYAVIDLENPACELQYGAWLRASPIKSRRRNAEMEMAEELFTAFRTHRTNLAARKKLVFNDGKGEVNNSKECTVQMVIADGDDTIPYGNVFKRKLGDSAGITGYDMVRVVEPSVG